MADVFTPAKRSAVMSRIRSKHTKPELRVRAAPRRLQVRFRSHVESLPGRPDFVLIEHQAVLLVHGCFWHSHTCIDGHSPRSNRAYWRPKLARNVQRERRNVRLLRQLGWHVIRLWECDVNSKKAPGSLEGLLTARLQRIVRSQ